MFLISVSCPELSFYCGLSSVLQAACSEVMAIRAARCYDLKTRTIVLANGTPCSEDNMLAAGGSEEYWKLVYQFCHALAEIQTDNTEYALFTAICIFSGNLILLICFNMCYKEFNGIETYMIITVMFSFNMGKRFCL